MTNAQWGLGEGFQLKALALSMRDPDFLIQHYDVFKPYYFDHDYMSSIASMVESYFKQHQVVPTREAIETSVNDYVTKYGGSNHVEVHKNYRDCLEKIWSADLSDSDFIFEKMVYFAKRQATKAALSKGVEMLEKHEPDLDKLREVLEEALRVGSVRETGFDFNLNAANLSNILKEDPLYGSEYKVPTGFPALDEGLGGGLGAGEILVAAGPPGRGKSTLLVCMGKAATFHFAHSKQNKIVVHITLEMKEGDIALKYATSYTGVPADKVLSNDPDYVKRMGETLNYLGDSNVRIKYFSPGTVTVDELRWYLSNLESTENTKIGLLIVDYADELKGADIDTYATMGRLYSQLIALGDKYRCPILTGTQISRSWSDEVVISSAGVAESWKKVQKADVIITLCQTPEEYRLGHMRLYLAKVRRAKGNAEIPCFWDGATSTIRPMTREEAVQAKQQLESQG